MDFKNSLISKIKSMLTKRDLFNSLFNALIRNLMGIRPVFKVAFKLIQKFDFNQIKNFLHIRIGFFLPQRSYPTFIDLDYYDRPEVHYVVNLRNLPFKSNTIEQIYVNYFFRYFPNPKLWKKALQNWYKKLIPGGELRLLLNKKEKESKRLNDLTEFLENLNFTSLKDEEKSELNEPLGDFYTLTFYKQIRNDNNKPNNFLIVNEKLAVIEKVLLNIKKSWYDNKKVIIVSNEMINLKSINTNAKLVKYIKHFDELKNNHHDYDFCIIYDKLEYLDRKSVSSFFTNNIREVLKQGSKILILVPHQHHFFVEKTSQLFNKGILSQILDENDLTIKWLNLDSSMNLILALVINELPYPLTTQDIKIAILGNMETRYSQLNSFWDGQIRALIKLGYSPLELDARALPFIEILRRIKKFEPDYLLTGDYAARDFLKVYSNYFKQSKIIVSYWYRDVRNPEIFDFNNIIDYVFLTNEGQIEEYKSNWNISNVYYLPQWCNPQFSHPNPNIKEKYEIGFAGQLDYGSFHRERTTLLLNLMKSFNVKIENAEYNSVSEFYSQCKVIFGNDIGFHQLFGKEYPAEKDDYNKFVYLYASNRIFISIGCGTCYFINYFPGIEKIFENKKHLVWYKNYKELVEIIQIYLNNDQERIKIKEEALKLAKQKHTNIHRIQNLLDIIMGKTNKFYGFLD